MKLKMVLASATAVFALATGVLAEGTVGIAMPTKSSARWISDGNSMVNQFQEAGYDTDLQYAEDDIPNQLLRRMGPEMRARVGEGLLGGVENLSSVLDL